MEAVAIRYIQIWVCRSLVISLPTQWRATRGHKRSCRWPGTHRISLYVGKHPVKNSIERQLWLGASNQGFSYIFGPGHPQISLSVHQLAIFLISMHVRGLLLFPPPLHSRLSILVDLLNVPLRYRWPGPPHCPTPSRFCTLLSTNQTWLREKRWDSRAGYFTGNQGNKHVLGCEVLGLYSL